MDKIELEKIQNLIGYSFGNTKLLEQAFCRNSFSNFHGGENNEVLEFYGDKVLSLAVIKDFYDLKGGFNSGGEFISARSVGRLNREYCSLVKNSHLAERITRLGLFKHLKVAGKIEKSSMKARADLFEAILGAVALDSDWNLQTISKVFHRMMFSNIVPKTESFTRGKGLLRYVLSKYKAA